MQNAHKSGILIITFGLRNNIKNRDVHFFFFFFVGLDTKMIAVVKQSQKKVLQYQYKI